MGKAPKSDKHRHGGKPAPQVYISRNKALDFLQLPLSRFRELCILKGIAPTVPPKKGYSSSATYYYVKDIKYLASDPLINKFRQWRVFMTKLRKLHDKNEENRMKNYLKTNKPVFTYDHLVKERYPNFNAALGDLDDCLQLCFLFSRLPAEMGIDPDLIKKLKRLTDEFCTYVAMTNGLRKVFVSFKGIYYQAMVCNTTVTWVVPFDFPQNIPTDVDFKVFKTFLMFYSTLLQFVNYKLFATLGICPPYPIAHKPKHDQATSHILDLESNTVTESSASVAPVKSSDEAQKLIDDKVKQIAKRQEQQEVEEDDQDFDEPKEEAAPESIQTDPEAIFMEKYKQMFKGNIFWISRECPRASLEFVIRCFGGQVAFDGPDSRYRHDDPRITHAVLDRPTIPNKIETRDYVQPQWVYDCINARIKLPMEPYRPGKKLPPHLSPFVEYEELSYVPKYAEEIRRMVSNEMQAIKNSVHGTDLNAVEQVQGDQVTSTTADEEEDAEFVYQREMEAEKAGMTHTELQSKLEQEKKDREVEMLIKSGAANAKSKKELKDQEERELKLTMASNKKKKLYKAAQDTVQAKVNEKQQLMAKRIQHEMEQKNNKSTATTTTTMAEEEEAHDVEETDRVAQDEEEDNFEGLIAEKSDNEEEQVTVQPNKKRKREEKPSKNNKPNKHKRQRKQ